MSLCRSVILHPKSQMTFSNDMQDTTQIQRLTGITVNTVLNAQWTCGPWQNPPRVNVASTLWEL